MNRHCYILPYKNMRYATVGDYHFTTDHNLIEFDIACLKDERMELLVLIHELVEELLTREAGIPEPLIREFDELFELDREAGMYKFDEEPGDDLKAPYRKQHQIATKIERYAAKLLDVDWREYTNKINNLE